MSTGIEWGHQTFTINEIKYLLSTHKTKHWQRNCLHNNDRSLILHNIYWWW